MYERLGIMLALPIMLRTNGYDMIGISRLRLLPEKIGMPALSTIVVFLLAGLGILLIPGPACIGYFAHPFEEWIVCRCNCERSDLFTPEETPFK